MAISKQLDLDHNHEDDSKPNLTPMIDLVFLLLVFFLLTTRFMPNERVMQSLLPTDNGGQAVTAVEPPPITRIAIYPAGHTPIMSVASNDARWHSQPNRQEVMVQIGSDAPIAVDVSQLQHPDLAQAETALHPIHAYLANHLTTVEIGGRRSDEDPVEIHCFSGLPWAVAMAAYDGVSHYESERATALGISPEQHQAEPRSIRFAAPRLRDHHSLAAGVELFEIMHTTSR